jgi:hypothetical protein
VPVPLTECILKPLRSVSEIAVYQALRSHHLLNVGTTEFEPERRPDRTRSLPTHDFEVGDENRLTHVELKSFKPERLSWTSSKSRCSLFHCTPSDRRCLARHG